MKQLEEEAAQATIINRRRKTLPKLVKASTGDQAPRKNGQSKDRLDLTRHKLYQPTIPNKGKPTSYEQQPYGPEHHNSTIRTPANVIRVLKPLSHTGQTRQSRLRRNLQTDVHNSSTNDIDNETTFYAQQDNLKVVSSNANKVSGLEKTNVSSHRNPTSFGDTTTNNRRAFPVDTLRTHLPTNMNNTQNNTYDNKNSINFSFHPDIATPKNSFAYESTRRPSAQRRSTLNRSLTHELEWMRSSTFGSGSGFPFVLGDINIDHQRGRRYSTRGSRTSKPYNVYRALGTDLPSISETNEVPDLYDPHRYSSRLQKVATKVNKVYTQRNSLAPQPSTTGGAIQWSIPDAASVSSYKRQIRPEAAIAASKTAFQSKYNLGSASVRTILKDGLVTQQSSAQELPSVKFKVKVISMEDESKRFRMFNNYFDTVLNLKPITRSVRIDASKRTGCTVCREKLKNPVATVHTKGMTWEEQEKAVHALDRHRLFQEHRVPTARASPANIRYPVPEEVVRTNVTPSEELARDLWWCNALNNRVRADGYKGVRDTSRFYPWANVNKEKIKQACCFFLNIATGPPPAYLAQGPPTRPLEEELARQKNQERELSELRLQHVRSKMGSGGKITPSGRQLSDFNEAPRRLLKASKSWLSSMGSDD